MSNKEGEESIDDSDEEMQVDSSETQEEDSENDAEEEALLKKKCAELESKITENPYMYDAYVELVECYKKSMDFKRLRTTYDRFSKQFPLTGTLWLAWIRDEVCIASSEKDHVYVEGLFQRAVEDYLSVDVWLEYVQWAMGQYGRDRVRDVLERAVQAAGLHVAAGSLLWDAYHEYEIAHLALIDKTAAPQDWLEQAARLAELYRRQLGVPLLHMERTYGEWRAWLDSLPNKQCAKPEETEYAYKEARQQLRACEEFERRLDAADSNPERLGVYREYVEALSRHPERVRCVYERAAAQLCLEADLWLDYCDHCITVADYGALVAVTGRALRNCPWSEQLWVARLRALEAAGRPHTDVTTCLEEALQAGLPTAHQHQQLWLAYLDHYRRATDTSDARQIERLRDAFHAAQRHLRGQFGEIGDPELTVVRLWADTEASLLGDVSTARQLWNEQGVVHAHAHSAALWLEFAAFEQRFGDEKHARRVFQRALQHVRDWPHSIMQAWLMYERQHGSIEAVLACERACRHYEHTHDSHATATGTQDTATPADNSTKKRKHQANNAVAARRDNKQPDTKPSAAKKRKHQGAVGRGEAGTSASDTRLAAIKHARTTTSKPQIVEQAEPRTVFVSNLDYELSEEALKEFLGPVERVELVRDAKGHSKGYAYCVFKEKEEAEKALARDREPLAGRPVYVSRCRADREQRRPAFKYVAAREQHKLFVRGLPASITQSQLDELFGAHGTVREVRLVTYRSGRPKGLAYVEFEDAASCARAVLATDNTTLDDHVISVAISDPPQRRLPSPAAPHQPKSRMQLPLIPRPLASSPASVPPASTTPHMTNEDFRKILRLK